MAIGDNEMSEENEILEENNIAEINNIEFEFEILRNYIE